MVSFSRRFDNSSWYTFLYCLFKMINFDDSIFLHIMLNRVRFHCSSNPPTTLKRGFIIMQDILICITRSLIHWMVALWTIQVILVFWSRLVCCWYVFVTVYTCTSDLYSYHGQTCSWWQHAYWYTLIHTSALHTTSSDIHIPDCWSHELIADANSVTNNIYCFQVVLYAHFDVIRADWKHILLYIRQRNMHGSMWMLLHRSYFNWIQHQDQPSNVKHG